SNCRARSLEEIRRAKDLRARLIGRVHRSKKTSSACNEHASIWKQHSSRVVKSSRMHRAERGPGLRCRRPDFAGKDSARQPDGIARDSTSSSENVAVGQKCNV